MTGWLWIFLTVVGVAILGVALAYGMVLTQRRRRNPAAQRRTEQATRQLYDQEEAREAREEAR